MIGRQQDSMAAKKTVTVATENHVRLGVERLATILLELAREQPARQSRAVIGDLVEPTLGTLPAPSANHNALRWSKGEDFTARVVTASIRPTRGRAEDFTVTRDFGGSDQSRSDWRF